MAEDWLEDELTTKGLDERPYVRTPESFPIRFRHVSREEFENLKPLYLATRTMNREEADIGFSALSSATMGPVVSALMSALERIERKLDLLLVESGSPVQEAPQGQVMEKGQCLDLSGSGVRFAAQRVIAEGELLKVMIHTPPLHAVHVVALVEVVRVDRRDDALSYEAGCKYAAIHEDDQEGIIAYTFTRQRELVRLRNREASSRD